MKKQPYAHQLVQLRAIPVLGAALKLNMRIIPQNVRAKNANQNKIAAVRAVKNVDHNAPVQRLNIAGKRVAETAASAAHAAKLFITMKAPLSN
jgi:hypothetical protein